eukprot:817962-Prymnesium_polylepis.1
MPPTAKEKKSGGPCVALSRDLGEGRKGVCGATESGKWHFNGTGELRASGLPGKPWCGARQCGFAVGARDEEKEKADAAAKKAAAKAAKQAAAEAAAAERAAARAQSAAAPPTARPAATRPASGLTAPPAAPTAPPAAPPADEIPACERLWKELSAAERAAAQQLDFEQWRWDAVVRSLHRDVGALDREYKFEGFVLDEVRDILGVRHC